MTPLANLVYALTMVLDIAINVAFVMLLARVVLSWLQVERGHPLIQVLFAITEPVLFPIRRRITRFTGHTAIDVAPLAALLALMFVQAFLVRTLYQLANALTF